MDLGSVRQLPIGFTGGPADPLLAAVISKLPPVGTGFTAEARTKWLRMMAMAFDVTYGEDGVVEIPNFIEKDAAAAPAAGEPLAGSAAAPAAAPARPKPAPHVAAGFDYYIDPDGFARCDFERTETGAQVPSPKRQVEPGEIGAEDVIYDYRSPRNRDSIVWADNTMGARPGMTFGGPG